MGLSALAAGADRTWHYTEYDNHTHADWRYDYQNPWSPRIDASVQLLSEVSSEETSTDTSTTQETVTTVNGACGNHDNIASREAGNHEWDTAQCGDETHVGFLCQMNESEHAWGTAPCSIISHSNNLCQINEAEHAWGTFSCGDSAHEGFLCNASPDHSILISGYFGTFYECQSHTTYGCGHTDLIINSMYHVYKMSCTTTNGVGVCTGANFYICQHTCTYPAPTLVACAAAATTGCTTLVSTRQQHYVTSCSNGCGRGYWTCYFMSVDWHTTVKTCKRSGCGQTYTGCVRGGYRCSGGAHEFHW